MKIINLFPMRKLLFLFESFVAIISFAIILSLTLGKREFDYPVNRTTSLKKKCQSVVDCVALRVIALNDTRGEEREVGKVRFVVRDGVTTE